MNFDLLFDEIGVNPPDRCFEQVFNEALSEYQNSGVYFLSDEYIDYVDSFTNCLSNCLKDLKLSAQKLCGNEAHSIYLLFLYRAMEHRQLFAEHINSLVFPETNDESMMLPFFAFLPEIPKLYSKLKKRNVPEDIIAATLRQFEDCAYLTKERTGKLGYLKRYFDHMQRYIDEKILNIGRLRFEMVQSLESQILVLQNDLGESSVLFNGAQINCAGRLWGTPPEEDNKGYFIADIEETETAYLGFCAELSGNCASCSHAHPKDIWKPVLKKGATASKRMLYREW